MEDEIFYISKKEAKARFIKFLMVNNCYKEYITSYKQYHYKRRELSPSEMFDRVIDTTCNIGYPLGKTLISIVASFDWMDSSVADVLHNMHNSPFVSRDDSFYYWRDISDKLREIYRNVFIRKD